MKTLSKNISVLVLSFLFIFTASCTDDSNDTSETTQGSLTISSKLIYSGSAGRNEITVSNFYLNLEEIELEFDDYDENYDDYDDDGYINSDDEIELEGPFEIDVFAGADIVTFNLPQASYDELEFEFDYNENPNSMLYEKTVLIEGTIGGVPFEFWHDFEAEAEVDFENESESININNTLNNIILSFDLDEILEQVDLSEATDSDGDGVIEINPDNDDENATIANSLKNAIVNNAYLEED